MKCARIYSVCFLFIIIAPICFVSIISLGSDDLTMELVEKGAEEEKGDEKKSEKEVEIKDLEDFVLANNLKEQVDETRMLAIFKKLEAESDNYKDVLTPPPEFI